MIVSDFDKDFIIGKDYITNYEATDVKILLDECNLTIYHMIFDNDMI